MKITYKIIIAAVASFAVFSSASPVLGQYVAVGDDGIAASPRLRERLDERNRSWYPAPTPAPIAKMPCPKCKDITVAQPASDGKVSVTARLATDGASQKVTRHGCAGCGVEWKVTGTGKSKQSVATHTCKACGSEDLACCNTTEGSTLATAGMGPNPADLNKSFEVAPLKTTK